MLEKKILSADEAADLIKEGHSVMVGGFLGCGAPETLLKAIERKGTGDLILICNDTGIYDPNKDFKLGVANLVVTKQFKKIIASHIGTNRETGNQMQSGETEVELVPQGTLAERIRAAGMGLGGILTPTGLGTEVEKGKEVLEIDGKSFLLEKPLSGNVALVKALRADKAGNLVFNKSARNFNPLIAMAAGIVIAEAEEIVEIGELDPEDIITPSILVHYLVKSEH